MDSYIETENDASNRRLIVHGPDQEAVDVVVSAVSIRFFSWVSSLKRLAPRESNTIASSFAAASTLDAVNMSLNV